MLVGCLFILLAADVRLSSVIGLGWGGIATVAVIMFVIRPLDIAASARGTSLTMKERAFMAWLSPRGIVAAAVASVFARRLTEAGMPVGEAFAAMVFLVIAVTVVVQGLSGGWVATKLGIRRPSEAGYIIVGANALGRRLGRALLDAGEDVALIDTNEMDVRAAEADGLRVLYGNGHDEVVLQQADIEGRRGLIAVTPNEGANLVIAQQARTRYRVPTAFAALRRGKAAVTEESALESGVQVLFGGPIDLDRWIRLAASKDTSFTTWSTTEEEPADLGGVLTRVENAEHRSALPLLTRARGAGTPVSRRTQILPNSELTVLLAPSTDGDPARGGGAFPA
jgi:voltage-gated potassium channel Kch